MKSDLTDLNIDQLSKNKKLVKNELKLYDTAFKINFLRLPNRSEKEPMRPL